MFALPQYLLLNRLDHVGFVLFFSSTIFGGAWRSIPAAPANGTREDGKENNHAEIISGVKKSSRSDERFVVVATNPQIWIKF